jgi:hypothetical protein
MTDDEEELTAAKGRVQQSIEKMISFGERVEPFGDQFVAIDPLGHERPIMSEEDVDLIKSAVKLGVLVPVHETVNGKRVESGYKWGRSRK